MPIFKSRRPMKKKPGGPAKMGGGGKKGKNLKKRPPKRLSKKRPDNEPQTNIENTGMEALYLKELIDEEKVVVIVLTSGEEIKGHVRYYDKDTFSIGPVDGGPRMFLRKTGVRYLYEE